MKKRKRKSLIEAEEQLLAVLRRVRYTGKYKGFTVNEIPSYKQDVQMHRTSDIIPGKTPKRLENKYSGDEILGIAQTHKSNAVPIRKDNKEAAVEVAQMRRN